MRRQALIFDFDGVVVETEGLHFSAWDAAFFERHGVRLPGDHRQMVGMSLEQIFRLFAERLSTPKLLDPSEQGALLQRKNDLFFEMGAGRLVPAAGVVDLVEQAWQAGCYVAIASRAMRMRLLRTLAAAQVPALFDAVMGSEDLVDPESDRKIHARSVAAFNIPPQRCVVIEDSARGVDDARVAGIGRVIGITTSLPAEDLRAAGAHRVIDRLDEIRLEDELPGGAQAKQR